MLGERTGEPAAFRVGLVLHRGSHREASNARQRWSRRSSWLLTLDDGAIRGQGEASPLPGHSRESLEEVREDLESLLAAPLTIAGPTTGARLEDVSTDLSWLRRASERLKTPSARFALEMALLDYWSQRHAVPVWRLLTRAPMAASLATSTVIDPSSEGALDRAERALGDGIGTLKLKVGRAPEAELAFAARLRARAGPDDLRLRIDANRTWPLRQTARYLERWAALAPEYVEEPSAHVAWEQPTEVPLALDESLRDVAPDVDWLARRRAARVLVLKPMLLGGIVRCLDWAHATRQTGKAVVVSHLFDGPLALSACAQLAFAIQSPEHALALGPHAGLAAWRSRCAPPAFVHLSRVERPEGPSLGARYTRRLSPIAAAEECPRHPALVLADRELSYGDLARCVEQVVLWLDESGAVAAARSSRRAVAFVAEARLGTLALLYACLELGLPVLPLHPRTTPEERQQQLAALRPAAWIDQAAVERLEARLEQTTASSGRLHGPATPWEWMGDAEPDEELDLAWVLTSGTTGSPKAARLSRRAFLAAADASALHLGWHPDDRWLLSLPFAHVGGLSVLIRCLVARRTVVVDGSRSPRDQLTTVHRHAVSLLSLVPTQLARWLELDTTPLPPSVRAILVGGARAPAELMKRARARGIPALRTYGLTEACSQVATEPLHLARSTSVAEGFVGRVLSGLEVRTAASGVIRVRGATLLSGYVDQAEPATTPDGWFSTSDRGRLDDAGLHVFGRLDHVFISGGENVFPEAVEAVISTHPNVIAACVVGLPDPRWGQGGVALVTLRAPAPPDELETWAATRLAPHERPKRWCIVDRLPSLPTGKLDRRAAAELARGR